MLTKGISEIRGIRSLNTRPGPITERNGFLKLYQLAVEKENLLKKSAWIKRQKCQTKKRLTEIAHTMHVIEEKAKRESSSVSHTGLRSTFISY